MQKSKKKSESILNQEKSEDESLEDHNIIHEKTRDISKYKPSLKTDIDFPRGGNDLDEPETSFPSNGLKRGTLFNEDTPVKRIKPNEAEKHKSKSFKGRNNFSYENLKIESLTFKTIAKGTIILGKIQQINPLNMVVSLPNNLVGYVSIENISKSFSCRLKKLIEENPENVLSLEDIFHKDQWIRVYVISTSTESSGVNSSMSLKDIKQKKKIELSIDPTYTNGSLNFSSIVDNLVIQASIISVEEYGYVADIGIEGISGFIKKKNTQYSILHEGQVILSTVIKKDKKGRVVQLSTDLSKMAKLPVNVSDIETLLPGNLVQLMVTKIYSNGICGKIMGILSATADIFHCKNTLSDMSSEFQVGKIVNSRIIFNFVNSEPKKVAVSFLYHIMKFSSIVDEKDLKNDPLDSIPIGFKIKNAIIKRIEPGIGVFCNIGLENIFGFVHISHLSDNKIESISPTTGHYKIGSSHRARVIGFSSIDGIYILSMLNSIYNQSHLRLEDFNVAELVSGTIEKIIPQGILVHIAEGITGIVPTLHISDVFLIHPEKKFKKGDKVSCKVLRVDTIKRTLILTLKKSLINSKYPEITNYNDIKINMKSSGVLKNILDNGAVVEFYNGIKAFLPVSEMSEVYVADPKVYFRIGQIVNVYIVSVDSDMQKIRVSCRDPTLWNKDKSEKFDKLELGSFVSGTIISNSNDFIVVSLDSSRLIGVIEVGHISDETIDKCKVLISKMKCGSHLTDMIVLNKKENQRVIVLSIKPSLIKSLKEGNLPSMLSQVKIGSCLFGYVKNIHDYGVFIGFIGDLVGLVLKQNLMDSHSTNLSSSFFLNQTVLCTVIDIDLEKKRIKLSMEHTNSIESIPKRLVLQDLDLNSNLDLNNIIGKIVQVEIISIKSTQLNVKIFEKYRGRIDVTQIYNSIEEIQNPKNPLEIFKVNQKIDAKIIGYHDPRNHKFLAITHRSSNVHKMFELTAKSKDLKEEMVHLLSLDDISINSTQMAFVNNIFQDCIWANISPNVKGRINILDISDNINVLQNISKHIHIGSAILCKVIRINSEINQLGLSIRALNPNYISDYNSVVIGSILPGRVMKIVETGFIVQISENVFGKIYLTDISDEYNTSLIKKYQKNQIICVFVLDVDVHNKSIALSSRDSRVISSTLNQRDPEIISVEQLKVGALLRGFIKNIAEKGLFISLSRNIVARVRIDEISDQFIQDWKSNFYLYGLIEGKIISINEDKKIEMTLKKSKLKSLEPLLEFSDVSKGQIVDGIVRKITKFGIYINLVGYNNVSGLCHISEIADCKINDICKIYTEGDTLRSYVLDVDYEKHQISLSLKSSYFQTKHQFSDETKTTDVFNDSNNEVIKDFSVNNTEFSKNIDVSSNLMDECEAKNKDEDIYMQTEENNFVDGLSLGKFDWTGNAGFDDNKLITTTEITNNHISKKKKNIDFSEDKTAILNELEPETPLDFERLLLGSPNSSYIWIKFMAFYVQLSEFDKAREVGERALKSINYRNEKEKFNIWIALMNLENTFGTNESLDDIFKRACKFNDPESVMKNLCSILIRSKKKEKVNDLFQLMIKKYNKSLDIWINYASFLMENNDHDASREIFSLSLKNIHESDFLKAKSKFAQLEFKYGDPERGRTLFESLLSNYPKCTDLWSVFLDYEIKYGEQDNVRKLFQRAVSIKMSSKKASFFFKKWIVYEKNHGTDESIEYVKHCAVQYVSNFT
ncbi:hypothetical protein PORY_000291 [Pneumocystis oryctolagi]|uniref:Uncharacterized protein n=1 Tax=Pneumocystis oryctolagi TaxID=42067 RepID=A0ACB7CGN8_9ASCO|nr:hypothetical protein PORY_000291 [Pneumocystis oryctolagi]